MARKAKRLITRVALYLGIIAATLVFVDVTCMLLGLFPPTYDYGDPEVGWVPARPTGAMRTDRCIEFSTGDTIAYPRNEDAIRTTASVEQLLGDHQSFKIAITGDSQTDLCAPNDQTHAGVLERELIAGGVPAIVLPYGAGRYSPLQDYLVFKKVLKRFRPDALVVNLYTGNDFYDILRVDDRPHFVRADSGYMVEKPIWYLYDDPAVRRHSRVLFALRSLAKASGLRGVYLRVQFLREIAAEQGEGLPTVLAYMNDLRKAVDPTVGYSGAFAAQILNQQLFFHRFPGARAESLRRIGAMLNLARRENPGMLLIMSPLPSYELAQQQPVDDALRRTLSRLPVTYEDGVREEGDLYEALQRLSEEHGWLFVDNLATLRAYRGTERLYNGFDYHLLPMGSELVGKEQAAVVLSQLRSQSR